ncbi:MAG: hypothetical protein AAFV53_19205 [Myxococcota bacterium]
MSRLGIPSALLVLLITLMTFAQPTPAQNHGSSPMAAEGSCAHCHANPHPDTQDLVCESCHTTAEWSPSTFDLVRHEQTRFPLEGQHREVACAQCHTGKRLVNLPLECAGCHVDRHRGKLGAQCEDCHTVDRFRPVPNFDHATTGFTLTGRHDNIDCDSCHTGDNGERMSMVADATCSTCHIPTHGDFRRSCDSCHLESHTGFDEARSPAVFAHASVGWPLNRNHRDQSCASCHAAGAADPLPLCVSCHTDPHAGQAGRICGDCHRADQWTITRFDHNMTAWPLRGKHFVVPCISCHTNQRWVGLSTRCGDCHGPAAARGNQIFPHPFGNPEFQECENCHNVWSFSFAR